MPQLRSAKTATQQGQNALSLLLRMKSKETSKIREDDKDDNDDNDDGTQHARLSSLEIITLKIPQLSNPHLQGGEEGEEGTEHIFSPSTKHNPSEIQQSNQAIQERNIIAKIDLATRKTHRSFQQSRFMETF